MVTKSYGLTTVRTEKSPLERLNEQAHIWFLNQIQTKKTVGRILFPKQMEIPMPLDQNQRTTNAQQSIYNAVIKNSNDFQVAGILLQRYFDTVWHSKCAMSNGLEQQIGKGMQIIGILRNLMFNGQ